MTDEERDALIAQGWTPPVAVDPDVAEATSFYYQHHDSFENLEETLLRAIKRGRELAAEAQPGMATPSIDEMTSRFLQWKLPTDFDPDGGITFSKEHLHPSPAHWPCGTNLLTYRQAEQMVRFMLNQPEEK